MGLLLLLLRARVYTPLLDDLDDPNGAPRDGCFLFFPCFPFFLGSFFFFAVCFSISSPFSRAESHSLSRSLYRG